MKKHINKFNNTEDFNNAIEELQTLKHFLVYNAETKEIGIKPRPKPLGKIMTFKFEEDDITLLAQLKEMSKMDSWVLIGRKDLFKSISYKGHDLLQGQNTPILDWSKYSVPSEEYKQMALAQYVLLNDDTTSWNKDYVITLEDVLKLENEELVENLILEIEVEFKDEVTDLSAMHPFWSVGLREISNNFFEDCYNVTNFSYAFDNSAFNDLLGLQVPNKLASACPIDKDGTPLYERSNKAKENYQLVTKHEGCFKSCEQMLDFNTIPFDWGGNGISNSQIIIHTDGTNLSKFVKRTENGEEVTYPIDTNPYLVNNAPYGFRINNETSAGESSIINIEFNDYDTSLVNNMYGMFVLCTKLTSLDLSSLNTSNVTNMSYMFTYCKLLNDVNFNGWNTSKVTDMSFMFGACTSLTSIDLNNWDVSKVTNMDSMFTTCTALTSIDINEWNTESLTNINGLFSGCSSLTSININNWNVSNINSMQSIFSDCTSLTSIDLNNWNVSKLTMLGNIFENCSSLASIRINNWEVLNLNSMSNVFSRCTALTSIDLNTWNVSNTSSINSLFKGCTSLPSIDLSNWNVSNTTYMRSVFENCSSLTSINISNWDVSKVTNMYSLFTNCTALPSIDLNEWKTESLSTIDYLFSGCSSLTSISINNWNVSKITNTRAIFKDCTSLTSIDLNSWNVAQLSYFNEGFSGCTSIKNININMWKPKNTISMESTFKNCTSLTTIDLNGLNIRHAPSLFDGCTNLESINISSWVIGSDNKISNMFQNCNKLTKIICRKAFRNWCLTNKDTVALPDAMFNGTFGVVGSGSNWELVDYEPLSIRFSVTPNDAIIAYSIDNELYDNTVLNDTAFIVDKGSTLYYKISKDGYETLQESQIIDSEIVITKELQKIVQPATVQFYPIPSSVNIAYSINDKSYNLSATYGEKYDVNQGDTVYYKFSQDGYKTLEGEQLIDSESEIIAKVLTEFGYFIEVSTTDEATLVNALDAEWRDSEEITIPSNSTNYRIDNIKYGFRFNNAANVKNITLRYLDTSLMEMMVFMFLDCKNIVSLDVSNFDTSKVTNMSNMFANCSSLTSLDLSNFDTSKVTNMYGMFGRCTNLTSLDLSNFDMTNVAVGDEVYEAMFNECTNLRHIKCSASTYSWFITHKDEVKLPTALQPDGEGEWEII